MTARRILIVSYQYAPMPFLGGDPWGAFAKHLRREGNEVTVLTTRAFGASPTDDSDGVVRTPDLIAAGALRRLLRRPPIAQPGGPVSPTKPAPAVLTKVLVPDACVASWAPTAARAARRLVSERAIECVVTTSPVESAHLVGIALGRRRPAWIADFRDGWSFEPLRGAFPTRPQRALDGALERAVVTRADRVLTATAPVARYVGRRFAVDAGHVPNPWDPELEDDARLAEAPLFEDGRVTLVYTGTLGGVRGHEPGALIEALGRLAREEPELAERLRVVIAGRLTSEEQAMFAALAPLVATTGPLARPPALALQRRADALLLITSRHVSPASGKLVEYLAAGRPILALAGDNEPARIVRETGTGVTVAPDDAVAIAEALRGVARGELERAFRPRDVERYTHPAPAEALAFEIERAIALRSGVTG